jgi:hypothetical protein
VEARERRERERARQAAETARQEREARERRARERARRAAERERQEREARERRERRRSRGRGLLGRIRGMFGRRRKANEPASLSSADSGQPSSSAADGKHT